MGEKVAPFAIESENDTVFAASVVTWLLIVDVGPDVHTLSFVRPYLEYAAMY